MNLHRLAEERSLEAHRLIARRLGEDPAVLARARARVLRWAQDGSVAAHYARSWAALLRLPPDRLAAHLVDPGEPMRELRQVSPFAGAVDPRTRWRIWREVRERLDPRSGAAAAPDGPP